MRLIETGMCQGRQLYLFQDPEKVVWPLGSWGESCIHTDKRVVAKGSLVNIVKRANFLVS